MRTAANRDHARSHPEPLRGRPRRDDTRGRRQRRSAYHHRGVIEDGPRAPNAAPEPAGGAPESSGGTGPTQADPLAWYAAAA